MAYIDFIPLTFETVDTIRARLDADANAGLSQGDPEFLDTTQGGFYWDLTQAPALEIERLWDFMATEVVAAMFVTFAWGKYLDWHGEVLGVARKDATFAEGTITFTGVDATVIPQGTQVGQPATSVDDDPVSFKTTTSATISGGTATVGIIAEEAGTGSNLPTSAINVPLTDIDGVTSVSNPSPTQGGTDVENDESYRARLLLEYSGTQGGGTIADYQQWALEEAGVYFVTVEPNTAPDGTSSGGFVRLQIAGPNRQPVSENTRVALQDRLDPPGAATTLSSAVTLPVATIPVVSTANFATSGNVRILGNTVAYTGKTANTLTGATGGTGTVAPGVRVSQGHDLANGLAPIGHDVTVLSVTSITANIAADLTFKTGYSLTGTGGTIALQAQINAALDAYFLTLGPGDDVILAAIIGQFFKVEGVLDVATSSVLLNGTNATLAVSANQVATRGSVTIT